MQDLPASKLYVMPELPDVEVYRKEAEKCKNSGIERIVVNDARFVKNSEIELNKNFQGKHFKQIMRRGKYLFLSAEKGASIVLHFGMTGDLSYLKASEKELKYTQCCFMFKNKHNLHVISKRKLGYIEMTDDVEGYIKKKDLGTDALEMNRNDFVSVMKSKKSMIKTVLTDQSTISGIGNEYADEILYQAKVHPRESTERISEKEMNKIYDVMNEIFKTAIKKDADISKLPDGYLLPVREKGNNCPGCKGKLEITKISGRTTYYCPSCQKSPDK